MLRKPRNDQVFGVVLFVGMLPLVKGLHVLVAIIPPWIPAFAGISLLGGAQWLFPYAGWGFGIRPCKLITRGQGIVKLQSLMICHCERTEGECGSLGEWG